MGSHATYLKFLQEDKFTESVIKIFRLFYFLLTLWKSPFFGFHPFQPDNRLTLNLDSSARDDYQLKSAGSSYCLMRHNRSINQLRENSSSSGTSTNYNFNIDCDNTVQNKPTMEPIMAAGLSNRKQTVSRKFWMKEISRFQINNLWNPWA